MLNKIRQSMVTMKHRFPQSFSTLACKNYRFFRDFYLGSRLLSLRQAALTSIGTHNNLWCYAHAWQYMCSVYRTHCNSSTGYLSLCTSLSSSFHLVDTTANHQKQQLQFCHLGMINRLEYQEMVFPGLRNSVVDVACVSCL